MNSRLMALLVWIGILGLAGGCAKYKITQPLEEVVPRMSGCRIGDITDQLLANFDEEKKPTLEHITKFKIYLKEELEKRDIFRILGSASSEAQYEVSGGILDFKQGSGIVRWLVGFGAGSAKVTVDLRLKDLKSGQVLFAGNFKQTVSSWMESGDKTFQRVASDFAKVLQKQIKKKEKEAESPLN
jgi:hypothetical protein